MARKPKNTTLDEDLFRKIQILALNLSANSGKKINTNDLLEEGMILVLEKYKDQA